jgi:hypothetical protein
MLYRRAPKTGDDLSILGFGCMRLPMTLGRIDETRATRQVRSAIDAGVNYIDTALPYHAGQSEPFVGRALRDGYREKVRVATKLPPWSVQSAADMEGVLCSQLDKLATDRIDYYLLHALDGRAWRKLDRLGVTSFLDAAKAGGRIGFAGFSFHGDRDAFGEILDAYDWDFCQIQYSYLDERNHAGTDGLRRAADKGLAVIVMEPLRGGNLTGKIPKAVQEIWDGAPIRRTPAEWALRWVWDHPEVTCVLSGMNREEHIAENLRLARVAEAGSLTPAERAVVERARDAYFAMTKVDCTGCRYCMPCPHGVDIPQCFELYNSVYMFPEVKTTRFMYPLRLNGFTDDPGFASRCTKCLKCVKKCPQKLPIPDLLEGVAAELETPLLRAFVWAGRRGMAVGNWVTRRAARRAVARREGDR